MIIGNNLHVEAFFDEATSTISYLLMDGETRKCALIDSVLDYDPKSGRTCTASADRLITRVKALDAEVQWILETHVHADHLSAAAYLKDKLGGHTAIGAHITQVQKVFGALFMPNPALPGMAASSMSCWRMKKVSVSATCMPVLCTRRGTPPPA